MWGHDPRTLLLLALLIDWFGQLVIFAGIMLSPGWPGCLLEVYTGSNFEAMADLLSTPLPTARLAIWELPSSAGAVSPFWC